MQNTSFAEALERLTGQRPTLIPAKNKVAMVEWKDVPAGAQDVRAGLDVALVTGQRSGVFVVDLDDKVGKTGTAEWERLQRERGAAPRTLTVRSPSGGLHLYFRWPGFAVETTRSKLASGIDVRGDGGIIIAPPSSGYVVEIDEAVVDAPPWLLERVRASERKEAVAAVDAPESSVPLERRVEYAKKWASAQDVAISGQGGHDRAMTVLGHAARDFVLPTRDALLAAVSEWNSRCVPPWDGAELEHKIDHALNHSPLEWDVGGVGILNAARRLSEPRSDGGRVQAYLQRLGIRSGGWDEPLEEPEYVVGRVLPKASVAMFYAHGDSLKTWAAFSMAHAVAIGAPWLDRYPTRAGRALVLDYEMGDYETRRRAKLLRIGEAPDLLHASYPDVRIDEEELWTMLLALDLSLVVVDSFAAGATGVDENDAKAARPLHFARRFAEVTGASVLFIHHANKGDRKDAREAVRGSSALFAALDAAYSFEALSEDPKTMRLHCTKMRRGRKPPPFAIRLTDERGLQLFEDADHAADRNECQRVLAALMREGPFANQDLLSRAAGMKKAEAVAAFRSLEESRQAVKLDGNYCADSEEKRRARILAAVREINERGGTLTTHQIALRAHVFDFEIEAEVRAKRISRSRESNAAAWLIGPEV